MGGRLRTQRHVALKLDEDGHLADACDWSPEVAAAMAAQCAIELGADHWRIIEALREFHAETGVAPSMRPLVRLVRERIGDDLASSIALLRLFPGSPAVLAAKVAGLPRPDKCL